MRLIVDMNLTPRWVQYLQDSGFECTHWSDIGPRTAEDSTICDHARKHEAVVITNDLDFLGSWLTRRMPAQVSSC